MEVRLRLRGRLAMSERYMERLGCAHWGLVIWGDGTTEKEQVPWPFADFLVTGHANVVLRGYQVKRSPADVILTCDACSRRAVLGLYCIYPSVVPRFFGSHF